jgi:SAM-dependent methyltransferase
MPTIPSSPPHRARAIAESFGVDPARYDRTRPTYPQVLIDRILDEAPGHEVLDVGIGTGVSARPFRAAGRHVLGIEPDERMAAFARAHGFDVEVSTFEDWNPAGRRFDLIVAGTTWHWVDPDAGAAKAAELLRPGGRLAVFWNVQQPPPELAHAFAEVYRGVLPGTPFAAGTADPLASYGGIFDRAADAIRSTGAFAEPERWRVDWARPYTREEWLDLVPTAGGHGLFGPEKLDELLTGLGAAIDAAGGGFTMWYAAVAVTAARTVAP